jgi:hypothetical protein
MSKDVEDIPEEMLDACRARCLRLGNHRSREGDDYSFFCLACNLPYRPKRLDTARYCSDACRAFAYRCRKRWGWPLTAQQYRERFGSFWERLDDGGR